MLRVTASRGDDIRIAADLGRCGFRGKQATGQGYAMMSLAEQRGRDPAKQHQGKTNLKEASSSARSDLSSHANHQSQGASRYHTYTIAQYAVPGGPSAPSAGEPAGRDLLWTDRHRSRAGLGKLGRGASGRALRRRATSMGTGL